MRSRYFFAGNLPGDERAFRCLFHAGWRAPEVCALRPDTGYRLVRVAQNTRT